jgi:hypothetical protein
VARLVNHTYQSGRPILVFGVSGLNFFVVMLLESAGMLADLRRFSIVFSVAAISYLTISPPTQFGLSGANSLFPFFLCGVGCSRFRIAKNHFLPIYITVVLSTVSYAIAGIRGFVPRSDGHSIIALAIGITACCSLFVSGWKNRTLAVIGSYAYGIFLFHVFFTAGTRIFARWINFDHVNILVAVATAAGVYGPILIEIVADQFAFTRTLLLGKAWLGPLPITATVVPKVNPLSFVGLD